MVRQGYVRVGIIGASPTYGWGKRAHLPAILALPDLKLAAVCTSTPETARASADAYGALLAFHDYREMVRCPEVDLVIVCVKMNKHHPMVMSALEAGKHVFCEWPLGMNVAEAQEMAQLAQAKGVRHMVGLQARGSPALRYFKELVDGGYLGAALTCNLTMFLPGHPKTSSTATMARKEEGSPGLNIYGGHSIDAFCWIMGEFVDVAAQVGTRVTAWTLADTGETVPVTAPDDVCLIGKLTSGATATVHVANGPSLITGWRMEAYGAEACLVATSPHSVQYSDVTLLGGKRGQGQLAPLPVPQRLTTIPNAVPKGEPFNVAVLLQGMVAGIRESHEVRPNFADAVQRHRLLEAIDQASAERRWLHVT
ncbi:MAG: Gfo/Idh/MocA family oxidoreductase [Chloroflexi bacterium]|nr:Gfo/Idh/MocA family oxidoreductase [Chloroflexota bacterium]